LDFHSLLKWRFDESDELNFRPFVAVALWIIVYVRYELQESPWQSFVVKSAVSTVLGFWCFQEAPGAVASMAAASLLAFASAIDAADSWIASQYDRCDDDKMVGGR
jgi:hypothetical protein